VVDFSFLQNIKTISNITIIDRMPNRDINIIVSVSDENDGDVEGGVEDVEDAEGGNGDVEDVEGGNGDVDTV
jgi:hypothetical protein